MNNLRRALIAMSAVVITCGLASGATLSATFSVVPTFGTSPFTNYGGNLNVATFDTSLGTLQSISFTFLSNIDSQITAASNDGGPFSGTQQTEVGFAFSDVNNIALNGTNFTFTSAGSHFANFPQINQLTASYTFNTTGSVTSGDLTATGFAQINNINNSSILAQFSTPGAGTTNLFFLSAAQTIGNLGGGNGTLTQSTIAPLTGSLVYTYVPTGAAPEPTTLFLMGSALIGVGLIRKKIVKK